MEALPPSLPQTPLGASEGELVDSRVGGAHAVFVGLVALEEVESGATLRDGALDQVREQDDAGTELRVCLWVVSRVIAKRLIAVDEIEISGSALAVHLDERELEPAGIIH